MAYFANGTEAEIYISQYCDRCVHGQNTEDGCPVMAVHYFFGYQLCNKKDDPGKQILDLLIPMKHTAAGLMPGKCTMFVKNKKEKGGQRGQGS